MDLDGRQQHSALNGGFRSLRDAGNGSLNEHSRGTRQCSELDRCIGQSLALRREWRRSTGTAGWLNDLWKFDPSTGTNGEWTWMGGSTSVGSGGGQLGVYGTLGIAASTNIPGGRFGAVSWIDASGNLWLFGGGGYGSTENGGALNDLWQFDPAL